MFVKRPWFFRVMCVTLGFFLALSSGEAAAAPKKIIFADQDWNSQKIHNEIAKFIVESAFDGYEVELATGSAFLLWQGMIKGNVDLDIEEWTENMPTYPDDVAGGHIIP
jgi:glycine betaine/proline transport system permease protein/glycine betaine/proline transport system substrate-binding protein